MVMLTSGGGKWVVTTHESYARAGRQLFELRRRGVTVLTTDCVTAAEAQFVGSRSPWTGTSKRSRGPPPC
jgi:hypothetical protein